MGKFCVYYILCPTCGATYVGSTKKGAASRARRHFNMLYGGCHYNSKMRNCFTMHGGLDFVVAQWLPSPEGLVEAEVGWARDLSSNVESGGMNLNYGMGGALGERASSCKISEEQALAIKTELHKGSSSQCDIARRHGVGRATVSEIAGAKTWAWLRPEWNESLMVRAIHRVGSGAHNAKKTESDVAEVKRAMVAGKSLWELRKETGWSGAHLTRIAKGEIWAHVEPELTQQTRAIDFRERMPKAGQRKYNKLSEEQASKAKEMLAGGASVADTAAEVGATYPQIRQIYIIRNWVTVKEELNDEIRKHHSDRLKSKTA